MRHVFTVFGTALVVAVVAAITLAAPPKRASLVGTYRLVGRAAKDGSVSTAPSVIGLFTFTRTYRNFNVAWKDANGKVFSYSVISKYTLTDSTYTETKLYSIVDDEIGGTGLKCDFEQQTKTVPVTYDGDRMTIKLPFDPVTLTAEGDKLTATGTGDFVDSWYKIR